MDQQRKKLEAGLEGLFSTFSISDEGEGEQEAEQEVKQPDPASSVPEQLAAAALPETRSPAPRAPVASVAKDDRKDGPKQQLVVFTLDNEYFGVDIGVVNSIVKLQSITALPQTPSYVKGITNLRGTVLPVIDLRKRFDLPAGEATKDTRIVNVELGGNEVGIVVDAVTEVLRVAEAAIEPPSPIVARIDPSFITGIAKVNGQSPEGAEGRLVILLDLVRVLLTDEQTELQSTQLETYRRNA